MGRSVSLRSVRPATGRWLQLQAHQFPNVFHGRTAVRDYLVVVFFEIELVAEFFLRGSVQIEMLSGTDEVGR